MKLPLDLPRRKHAERDDRAGCMVCWGARPRWTSRNAQALAAKHHDRTGHETWYTCEIAVVYGGPAVDARQTDIEDAIAASATPDRGLSSAEEQSSCCTRKVAGSIPAGSTIAREARA